MDNNTTPKSDAVMFNWQMAEVLNHINIGFFSKDVVANKYISLSEGCPKIYGYTLADFLDNGNIWYDVIHEDDKHVSDREMEVLTSGKKSIAEYRIYHRTGSIRWLEVRTLPVFKNDTLVRVEGIVYDITDRKNAELQTIRAKELSEQIINSLPGIFYLFNEEGEYLNWNKNFEIITGYSAEEIKKLKPLELICPEDRTLVENAMEYVFENGYSDVEARLLLKNGKTSMYYFNGQKLVVEGKNCLAGMGIDISERKDAIATLQKNEQMLSHIFDLIPHAIFWKDSNGVFLGGNRVFARMAGADDISSIIGKNDFDFSWAAEEARKYQQDDLEVMRSRKPKIHYVESQTQADGEKIWLDTTKIPLIDPDGNANGILVVIDDITEKKLREDEQKRANEDLIQKNIGLKEFSYIVSHNLRAPIAKILGLASLFEKDKPDSELNQEIIELVSNEVSDLDHIVKDLNTILAHQSPDGRIIETIPLEELVVESRKRFQNEINQSEADIRSNFDEVNAVKSVRSYLHSIFNNLISNAIKFRHPDRPPQITITSHADESFTCITFRDNGLGLDLARYGDKIFGLYNNFHKGTSLGAGIGLKLTKTQVEALGGKITLESSPGAGSTFKVFLPLEPINY